MLPASKPAFTALRAALAGRHLFMSGGTGFVGKTMLDCLIALQGQQQGAFRCTVLSRDPAGFLALYPRYADLPWLDLIAGSLEHLPVARTDYTDVVHAAADTHLHGDGSRWVRQIVGGTQAMLDFAVSCGAQRFLLTSSGAIYGPQPGGLERLPEDYIGAPSPSLPGSTYGQAKRVAEQLCTIYLHEHGLQTVSARCFAFAGEHIPLDGAYAIGNFIRDALYRDAIRVRGDGTAVRSYLDGEDMAHWLLHLLCHGQAGEAYNIGGSQAVTMAELAAAVAAALAPEKAVLIEQAMPDSGQRSRYVPDISKVAALGLYPAYTLDETIRRTAQAVLSAANIEQKSPAGS